MRYSFTGVPGTRVPPGPVCASGALLLEPESGKASYVAGLALLQQNKRTEEGLAGLRVAATA